MLKGWVRFVASKEPRNQYLYSVLIDLEGDSYERFTKCSVLVKQLCLHWQLCIPNKLRLLIQSLLLSNSLFTPIYWNFFTALLLADMIQPPLAIEWRFFYLLYPASLSSQTLSNFNLVHCAEYYSHKHIRLSLHSASNCMKVYDIVQKNNF